MVETEQIERRIDCEQGMSMISVLFQWYILASPALKGQAKC